MVIMENNIQYYKFLSDLFLLASKSYNREFKPHKFILLLTIIELIDSEYIVENKIYLDKLLLKTYIKYQKYFIQRKDSIRPWYPFFHFRSSPFWDHKIKFKMENEYKLLKSEQGLKAINSIIDYAYFDEKVFLLLMDRQLRSKIENMVMGIIIENVDKLNE